MQRVPEPCDHDIEAEVEENDLDISGLEATTGAHDDWLHRGPFLFDMDLHTYQRFVMRRPRPKDQQISDAARVEEVFFLMLTTHSPHRIGNS